MLLEFKFKSRKNSHLKDEKEIVKYTLQINLQLK